MNAYIVVGPTKLQPRFLRSFDKAIDSGEVMKDEISAAVGRFGRVDALGSNCQMYAPSEPYSLMSSRHR